MCGLSRRMHSFVTIPQKGPVWFNESCKEWSQSRKIDCAHLAGCQVTTSCLFVKLAFTIFWHISHNALASFSSSAWVDGGHRQQLLKYMPPMLLRSGDTAQYTVVAAACCYKRQMDFNLKLDGCSVEHLCCLRFTMHLSYIYCEHTLIGVMGNLDYCLVIFYISHKKCSKEHVLGDVI